MLRWIGALIVLAVTSANAQTVMDRSYDKLGPGEIEKIREAARDKLYDPYSAQIVDIYRGTDGWICGMMNSKNKAGGYVRFNHFAANIIYPVLIIDNKNKIGKNVKEIDEEIRLIKSMQNYCLGQR